MSGRYSLVPSLYAPGTVGGWLFTVGSTLVSWTLNPHSRKKDSINNDFIAALCFPLVAACHLLLQIRHYPGDKSVIMTTEDDTLLKHVASIEASLNVCETFATIALILFLISAYNRNLKRAAFIAIVGLFCFAGEVALSFQGSTVRPSKSQLSRPFILNFPGAIIVIIAVLCHIALLYLFWFLILALFTWDQRSEFNFEYEGGPLVRIHMTPDNLFWIANISVLPVSFFSGSFVWFASAGIFGESALMAAQPYIWRQLRAFLPKTNTSVQELDQVVALVAGCMTFLFSIYDTFRAILERSHDRSREREQQIEEIELELMQPVSGAGFYSV